MEQVSEQGWYIVVGAGGLIGGVALLLLFRAWRTAVKAVDRMVGCIEVYGKSEAMADPMKMLKRSVQVGGVAGCDREPHVVYRDAASHLIHKRVRRNDG